jgi:allophanate hydrolase subunit 2
MHLGEPPGGPLVPDPRVVASAIEARGLDGIRYFVGPYGSPRVLLPGEDVPEPDETWLVPAARDVVVRVVPGPDPERFDPAALPTLLDAVWTVLPASDRVGTRLAGPPIRRRDADDARSAPMVRGAIEVPAGGAPLVLGPDHPTTGGYPVLAVVLRADWGLVGACVPGSTVRFRIAPLR